MSQEFTDAIQDETIEKAMAESGEMPARDTYFELVECSLTDEEKAARRVELEGIDREIIRLEEQKKADNKVINGEIKVQKAKKDCILEALESGAEKRQVECYEFAVTSPQGVLLHYEIRRVDTDEKVDERAATSDEQEENRQPGLFDGGGSAPPPADDDEDEEPFEPTPEALAQAAEDEGRVVKTNSKAVRGKKAKQNGSAEA
ncbi:MAG TPA: hypothetical protein VL494_13560 [Steroidobacteraceae bacterium]|jgi:hypothetical protein|nr:hypothetical protein [Steroidobacteraceae bacterium]